MEEQSAPEISVTTYGTTCCRNPMEQNQNSLFSLWLVLNSSSITKIYLHKLQTYTGTEYTE